MQFTDLTEGVTLASFSSSLAFICALAAAISSSIADKSSLARFRFSYKRKQK